MIQPESLPAVRRAIRDYLEIPESEPADMLILAAFLLNHVPGREWNLWFVLVSPPDTGKTELLRLISRYKTATQLSQRPSPGFLLSAKTLDRSGIFKLERNGVRSIVTFDMADLTDAVHRQYREQLYAQLLNFHDGHMKLETGNNEATLEWGPKPWDQTIGWIGAATERWYDWLHHQNSIGNRFLVYYMSTARAHHWTDTSATERILAGITGKDVRRKEAEQIVHRFLDSAIEQIADFHRVEIPDEAEVHRRFAKAAALVGRVLSAGGTQGTGSRRSTRYVAIAKMLAFMHGRLEVNEDDIEAALGVALSEIIPDYARVIQFACQPENIGTRWSPKDYFRALGGSRQYLYRIFESLTDAGILDKEEKRTGQFEQWRLTLHRDVMRTMRRIDPHGRIFAFRDAIPLTDDVVMPAETVDPVRELLDDEIEAPTM